MVRRPRVSEKEDHQRGKMDMESMYIATEKLVIVGVLLRSVASCGNAAIINSFQSDINDEERKWGWGLRRRIALPIGAAAAANATCSVMSHFVLLL
jgi:hypothetical protein